MTYYCGIDIGGTFTDCVVVDSDGDVILAKSSSTPEDFSQGFMNALEQAAQTLGLDLRELLARTELMLHGTTVGTNILVQQKGAAAGLITTSGHRDALLMMRSKGRSAGLPFEQLLRVSRHRKPKPIIPPHLIKEITERVDWRGEVIVELNEEEARQAIQELLDLGVEAIAVSFLWGFVNTAHERRVRELIEEMAPSVFVTCAHELVAKPGEYERTAATAINAYIGPSTSRYVERLEDQLASNGYRNPLLIMQAAGGVVPSSQAVSSPLNTIGSGPVGGVTGSKVLGSRTGQENIIACDMGGTSFDVGIVRDGAPIASTESITNQYSYFMPRLEIESIGAGGGSVIWVDAGSETLRVGPESAGAEPGPACYGRGGTRPTVTDANLVLGYMSPKGLIGGQLGLDKDAAVRAMESVADPLGMDPTQAAAGAIRIVNHHMGELMRQMTVEQGLDPRDFVIYAYGGAGPLHATGFARELGAKQVIVPLADMASTWSALGVVSSDILHVYEHAELMSEPFSPERLNTIFRDMEQRAAEQLRADGIADGDMSMSRSLDMKFSLQIHEVEVPLGSATITADVLDRQMEEFVHLYESIFGRGSAYVDAGVQIGLCRVRAWGQIRQPDLAAHGGAEEGLEPGRREVFWPELGQFEDTAIYDGAALPESFQIAGPAVIELPDTTILVHPGDRARLDQHGSVVLDLAADVGGGNGSSHLRRLVND